MAQSDNEKNKADSVAKQSDQSDNRKCLNIGQARSKRERRGSVDTTCRKSLEHRNLYRIGGRHLTGKVVVSGPGKTRAADRQGTPACTSHRNTKPGERNRAQADEDHSQRDPAVEILPKHEPRQKRGEYSFQIQQKRRRRSGSTAQTQHEQKRRNDSPTSNCASEPGDIFLR